MFWAKWAGRCPSHALAVRVTPITFAVLRGPRVSAAGASPAKIRAL
jgi:hypothetical protein